ncbi:DNA polymerase III subunit delta [Fusobacterium nucleatum]|uniref:DNA polymerase III subunit delta n=1 Tax=Fusobacterium nucleatum TaxID=851 RepID=UPI003CFF64BC
MFYFLYGNSPMIEFETEKITEEILRKYPNIIPKFFDCSLKEDDEFLSALQVNSIFKTVDFLILKRSENLKNSGIQKLFKSIKNYSLDEKNIIIIYNVPIQYGKIVSDYELTKASIKSIEELAYFIDCTVLKESEAALNYVKQNLNITEKDAKVFIGILGNDYYHIKNETNKVATFLEGQPYSFEKIKNLISIDKEYNIKDLIDNFLKTKNFSDILSFLEKNKDSYLAVIYMITDELINLLKLASLIETGKISRNINYNVFKELYNDFSDLFIGKNFRTQHPYTIFLKLNSFENFSEEFLEKKLKELLEIEYKVKSGERDIEIETEVFLGNFFKNGPL